ncbi:hypothetical protein [Pseudoponticoccus marisrubri]|uniref:Uncharacterized protein n=1 Tax=Pseudoponticoccus marisrubri TaxID=1685382 RepID=A0A0W7WEG9_9RHOB|nr:hypothetical protein [Pseudoponticoccus marisrubri]KUF08871.1 hypothetical protein AVJ23_20505 [Pseudoponticoccus marisrubri]
MRLPPISCLLILCAGLVGAEPASVMDHPGADPVSPGQRIFDLLDRDALAQSCCKVCRKGKACGDSCISRSLTCRKGQGCACDG